jgi:hypothetical protein
VEKIRAESRSLESMDSRVKSRLKVVYSRDAAGERQKRLKRTIVSSLRWLGNAFGLLGSAAVLAWLVVRLGR